jgi:hypothetical protein
VQELRRSIKYMGCIQKKRRGRDRDVFRKEREKGLMESGEHDTPKIDVLAEIIETDE